MPFFYFVSFEIEVSFNIEDIQNDFQNKSSYILQMLQIKLTINYVFFNFIILKPCENETIQ